MELHLFLRSLSRKTGVVPTTLTFRLDGHEWRPKNVTEALNEDVAWLPAGRASNCVYPSLTIAENQMVTQLKTFTRGGFINTRRADLVADKLLQDCGVKYADKQDLLTSLSGGNQQKVLLARAMASAAKILVLEEPTAGVDIDAKHEIHQRIRALAASGVSVIMLSSDLEETMRLSDTVWTMFHGRMVSTYGFVE